MSRRTLRIAIALAVLCCGLSAPALAVDRDWVNGSGGFFQTTTNWDPIGVPTSIDRAIFDLNGTYTVSFIGSRTNSRLLVSDGDVTFDLNAATYTLSNTGSTSLIVGEALRGIGAAGRLTIADGTVSAVGGEIGRIGLIGGGGSGTVAVTTGGTLRFSSLLAVGSTRSGTLLVNNGADLITGSITSIGLDGAGAVAVSGPGSSWMSTSWIDVAGNAPGTISITGGGTVSDSFATVGANNVALAVVDGAGSRWTHAGNFRVGEFGSAVATLNITNGGFVTQTGSGALGIIGDQFGSRGTVNVDGNGSRWTNTGGQLQVGYIGNATLNISNGALVSSFSNDVSVGHSGGSTGVVTIGGAGTFAATLSGRSVYVGGNPTGDGGTGSITINSGGHVQASNSGLVKLWPGGRIDLAGGMLQGGSFQLAGGSLNWSSGTLYITNETVRVNSGGMLGANVTVGAGKALLVPGLEVAPTGAGSLSVLGGATLNSYSATFGVAAASNGTLLLGGAGTTWYTSDLTVGEAGNGTVVVSGGAALTSPASFDAFFGSRLATMPTGTANVIVTGPASSWNVSATNAAPGLLQVGALGSATIQIANGANIVSDFTHVELGSGTNSAGTALLSGGAQWNIGTADLNVGMFGDGYLAVSGGSDVANDFGVVGFAELSDGVATVSGNGSTWTNRAALVIGDFGSGVATFSGGANVTGANVYVALSTGSAGQLTIQDPGTSLVSTGSMQQIIVGGAGTGTMRILNGATTQGEQTIAGDGFPAVGTILVSGPGSRLDTAELEIGFNGDGTVVLNNGAVVHTEETFLGVGTAATAHLRLDGGTFTASTWLSVRNNALVQYNAGTLNVGTLHVTANGRLAMSSGRDKVVHAGSISINTATGAKVDIADNYLIVDYTGASLHDHVAAAVRSAYAGGAWTGNGITSFLADASEMSVGYAEAPAVFTSFPATFGGRTVDATSVLVTLTRYGDANLDGTVNLADFNRLASNFGQANRFWSQGDFTHDGVVTLADFNRLASNFGLSAAGPTVTPEDWAALASVVPEPFAMTLLALLVALGMRPPSRVPS